MVVFMRNNIMITNETLVVNIDNTEYAFSINHQYGGELVATRTEPLEENDYSRALEWGLNPINIDSLTYVVRRVAILNNWKAYPVNVKIENRDCKGNLCDPYRVIEIGWRTANCQKDIYYIQETIGGWRQNAVFQGTYEECQEYWDENPMLYYGNYSIVNISEYEVDYL